MRNVVAAPACRASGPSLSSGVVITLEDAMSIIRLIHITIDPSEIETALQVWKKECAPLMIQQKGCISEKLLRCREVHELISYSEWASEADIEAYRNSDAHKEIVQHARSLRGSKAKVKLYDLVE
jgi:heme-degrading monooxygenase HmoA